VELYIQIINQGVAFHMHDNKRLTENWYTHTSQVLPAIAVLPYPLDHSVQTTRVLLGSTWQLVYASSWYMFSFAFTYDD
jgi:hypothetical protein